MHSERKRIGSKGRRTAAVLFVAVFFFGGAVSLGTGIGAVEILAAWVIAMVIFMPVSLSARRFFSCTQKGILRSILWILIAVVALAFSAISVVDLSNYASEIIIEGTPELLLRIIFVLLCAYLGHLGPLAVRKIGVVVAFLTGTLAVVLFVMSAPSFRWNNLVGSVGVGGQIRNVLSAFGELFAPAAVGIMLISSERKSETGLSTRNVLLGVSAAVAFTLLCLLNVILVLGNNVEYRYPYSIAVSTVTAGKLFARLEGFVYFMMCACEAVKGAAGIALAVRMTEFISPVLKGRGVRVSAAAVLILLLSYM